MIEHIDTEVAEIGVRLLDDAYLAWFGAESESEGALHAWFRAAGDRRASAYLTYPRGPGPRKGQRPGSGTAMAGVCACGGALVAGNESVR